MTPALDRQRNILDFTLSSLLRRRGKLLSLVFIYSTVVFVLASIMFFTHALRREAQILLADAPELVVQRMVGGRHDPIPLEYAVAISEIRGVSGVQPRFWGYYYDADLGANYTLQAVSDNSLQPGNIAIGAGLAQLRGLGNGDAFSLWGSDGQPRTFTVSRVFSPASDLLTTDLIMTTERDLRELFHFSKGTATDLSVAVRNPREVQTVAERIVELFPDCRPITRDDIQRTYTAVFDWRSGILLVTASMAIWAFVIFSWDRASGISASERQEIGILKSTGWATEDILLLKLWEGIIVSLTSFLLGLIGAYVHIFFFSAPLFTSVLKGWATLYPSFRLTPFIDYYQVAILFVLSVFPFLLATIVPSWRAAIIDPDNAMRGGA
ncbi:MAG: ABC transporter permease [Desulfuromonadaceae bacterium]